MHSFHFFKSFAVLATFTFSLFFVHHAMAQDIQDSAQALKFVLEGEKVPNAASVKLEYMKATISSKGRQWKFTFRDADKQYKVTVGAKGQFKLKKEFDEDEDNAEFWATLPAPSSVQTDLEYLEKAKVVVENFNSTFKAQDRAIIEYFVCDAPAKGKVSKYSNGCKSDKVKQWWEIAVQIKNAEDSFFRKIEFQNDQPVTLSKVSVYGNW
ncbi:MAG: hypothetical protein ACRBHB_20210 [Arenicella sp.]